MIFFKVLIKFLYANLSGGTLLISVMSQQYSSLIELYIYYHKISPFMKIYIFPILRYVRAKITVGAFGIKLDRLVY